MATNLNKLRQQIKIKLQHLPSRTRAIISQRIATKVIRSKIFIQSKNIACYIPIDNEVNTWPIIKSIWRQNKNCYLPAFILPTKNLLCFVRFLPGDQLNITKFKTFEPQIMPEKVMPPQNLDLVIVPLLGFNSNNFRLGRGAGCYDHTFAFKQVNKKNFKPYLLGVGYQCQLVKFKPNAWDIAMNEIIML